VESSNLRAIVDSIKISSSVDYSPLLARISHIFQHLSILEKQGIISFNHFRNLGIVLIAPAADNSGPVIESYYNYINQDHYFLKAVGKSKSANSSDSCIGCSLLAIKTEIDGSRHPIMGVQQYATSGTRLQLPYMFFGLGRTNNYIENFMLAVSKNGSGPEDWSFMWTPIIPNS